LSWERNSPLIGRWISNSREITFQETEEMDFCKTIIVSECVKTNQIIHKHFLVIFESNKNTTTAKNSQGFARKRRPTLITSRREKKEDRKARKAPNERNSELKIRNQTPVVQIQDGEWQSGGWLRSRDRKWRFS
jgi:hypothetical protein